MWDKALQRAEQGLACGSPEALYSSIRKNMGLIEELQKWEAVSLIAERTGVYIKETPSFRFTHYVYEPASHGWIAQITARGDFEEAVVREALAALVAHELAADLTSPLSVLPARVGAFDQLCLINCQCHGMFRTFSQVLHDKTLVTFPSYRSEFVGNESPKVIEMMRRDLVDTVDWNREPSPKMRMRNDNKTTGMGSKGMKLGFTRLSEALQSVKELEGCEGFAEVENYRAQVAVIESTGAYFIIKEKGGPDVRKLRIDEVCAWLLAFTTT